MQGRLRTEKGGAQLKAAIGVPMYLCTVRAILGRTTERWSKTQGSGNPFQTAIRCVPLKCPEMPRCTYVWLFSSHKPLRIQRGKLGAHGRQKTALKQSKPAEINESQGKPKNIYKQNAKQNTNMNRCRSEHGVPSATTAETLDTWRLSSLLHQGTAFVLSCRRSYPYYD